MNLDVQWEGDGGRRKGTISDISINGCFVLCQGDVLDNELIKIEFTLSNQKISLWGCVVNHTEDIGFGLRFNIAGDTEEKFLKKLIERVKGKGPRR